MTNIETIKSIIFLTLIAYLERQIEREKKQARQQKLLASQDFDGRTNVNEKDSENGTLLPNNTIKPANADSLG